jgi:hypothetical protein
MSERETKEFTTPGGHKVILCTYLTGREAKELKAIMYADLKINATEAASGKSALSDIPVTFVLAQEDKAIELLVVSLDGVTENVVDKLGDLPEPDYNAVIAEIQKIRVPLVPKS